MWAGQESILRFAILIDFFLGPWLVVCQFIDISNQIEPTGEVANILQKNLYNAALNKFFNSKFDTSPFDFIWLEISKNLHTSSQGPKKNLSKLQKGGLTPVPLTLLVIRVVLLLWSYGSYKGFWAQL